MARLVIMSPAYVTLNALRVAAALIPCTSISWVLIVLVGIVLGRGQDGQRFADCWLKWWGAPQRHAMPSMAR